MSNNFSAGFFKNNRTQLRSLFTGTAPIVLTANGLMQSTADMTFAFRQDRNFWYLTGVDEPDLILVLDKGREYIILPEEHAHRRDYEGGATAEQIAKTSGVTEVLDFRTGWRKLRLRVKKVKHVATLAASSAHVPYYGFYSNPARARLIKKIKSMNAQVELLDIRQHMSVLRMVKQPEELDAIKQAIDITERTLKSVVRRSWLPTTTEQDIANELQYQFKKLGGGGTAFDSVVTFGARAASIHSVPSNIKLPRSGLVLLDVGAEYNHYASDITRLFKVDKVTRRTQKVYDAVLECLDEAIEKIKPGVVQQEYEEEMEAIVGEKLRELGLIKTIDHANVRKYFPTYTAHQLGLDTHDANDRDKPFAAGMVLAVEPGIYIPEEGVGIRLEENVLVTENGCDILTTGLSRDIMSLTIKDN